jgi:hypothetical protein
MRLKLSEDTQMSTHRQWQRQHWFSGSSCLEFSTLQLPSWEIWTVGWIEFSLVVWIFIFFYNNELRIMGVEETVILLLFYEGWSCGLLRFYLSCYSWLCRTGKSSSNYQTQGPLKVLLMMSITPVEEIW